MPAQSMNLHSSQSALMIALCVAALFFAPSACAQSPRDARMSELIRDTLTEVVANEEVPGMIAAISDSRGVMAVGSAGVRRVGLDVAITDADLVHIGSCTKAMTSTMMATLVAEGMLTWESTLIEVIPELEIYLHSDFQRVTLWQLLTHRAGFPANAKNWRAFGEKEIKERRLAILGDTLSEARDIEAGEYRYSNLGYMAAGAMAEALTGVAWESLIKKRIFEPLGMHSADFGPPGRPDRTVQPWGHVMLGGKWRPRHSDNAEALGPAGRVHCSLEDWAKFASLQLPLFRTSILDRRLLDKLIEPEGDRAAGWIVVQRTWAGGTALTHSGSNTMWYATVWVAPELDRAFFVATNSSDASSPTVCDKVIGKLIAINGEDAED